MLKYIDDYVKNLIGKDIYTFWWSGETYLLGKIFSVSSNKPIYFLRITRLKEESYLHQVYQLLKVLCQNQELTNTVEKPTSYQYIKNYGHILITEFLPATFKSAHNITKYNILNILDWLETISHFPVKEVSHIDLPDRYSLKHIVDYFPKDIVFEWESQLQKLLPYVSDKKVISHGDFSFNNIAWNKQKIHVIDWEWAKISYPDFDLLCIRMHWLMAIHRKQIKTNKDYIYLLTSFLKNDPFISKFKNQNDFWKEIFQYFCLTYSSRWLFDCVSQDEWFIYFMNEFPNI